MDNLVLSNIIADYISEHKLFLAIVCDLFAIRHTRGVIKIIFQFKFFVNTMVFV